MQSEELQRLLDESPLHVTLGLRATGGAGRGPGGEGVVLEAAPNRTHSVDGGDYLHGGVIATLLDTAATFALIEKTGEDWSTVDLRVDYLRPAPISRLCVTGRALQVGRRLGRAIAELSEPQSGDLLASAVGTFVRS